jgi:hypothetical protein
MLWYLALVPIRVASFSVPSSKRQISIGIGNALASLKNGIYFANIWYPSADNIKD